MTKKGMSAKEADSIVHAEKHPFKPAYPREESKRDEAKQRVRQ